MTWFENMYRASLIIISCLLFLGCVSTKTKEISYDAIKSMESGDILISSRESPSFQPLTVQSSLLLNYGTSAKGEQLIEHYGIEDPAHLIAKDLIENIQYRYGVERSKEMSPMVFGNDLASIIETPISSKYLLDLQTIHWGFSPFSFNWTHYEVQYIAKLRLIDVQNKTLLAEDYCQFSSGGSTNAPSYEALFVDNAERLKTELFNAALYCLTKFKTDTLFL